MMLHRPVVWHVGRQGDVAGGMTQVVNGYLAWPFDAVDVRVVRSRDGSRGLRAWAIFLLAIWQVMSIQDRRRNLFVVHLSQGGSFVREGLLLRLARWRGFGVVAHLHGSRFVDYARERPRRVARVLAAASRIIVLSDATREAVAALVPGGRVLLVPNAVPAGVECAKEPLVVFGGAVSLRKGVDVLVSAWQELCKGPGKGWRLVVAGPQADANAFVPADWPATDFTGAVSHEALMQLLERAAVAVLPSRDEAMPMFILEALARRCCVVATKVGGVPEVLREEAGVLVDAGDTRQLAIALALVMSDSERRDRVAQTGWRRFDANYSARAVYPKMEAMWLEVLAEAGSAS